MSIHTSSGSMTADTSSTQHDQHVPSSATSVLDATKHRPRSMNDRLDVLIMIFGTRGDAEQMSRVAIILQETGKYRVRMAGAKRHRELIEARKLDFFPIDCDPQIFIDFRTDNGGDVPKFKNIRNGRLKQVQLAFSRMAEGFWEACTAQTGSAEKQNGASRPFVAEAIISNTPNMAHYHCAEKLGVPILMVSLQPRAPTRAFPHHMANRKLMKRPECQENYQTWKRVEGRLYLTTYSRVNKFRVKTVGLGSLPRIGTIYRFTKGLPQVGMWSPEVIPKPRDWGPEIDVVGFPRPPNTPLNSSIPEALQEFLNKGPAPIYVGFGSCSHRHPEELTRIILKAIKVAGVRAVINPGWAGIGDSIKDDELDRAQVYRTTDVPHSLLLPLMSAIVHHGGAGTVASQLRAGKPGLIVPFCADQHFWGSVVDGLGANPPSIPVENLTVSALANALKQILAPESSYQTRAKELGERIAMERDGSELLAEVFQRVVDQKPKKKCSVFPTAPASWVVRGSQIYLSGAAADILVNRGHVSWKQLDLLPHWEWDLGMKKPSKKQLKYSESSTEQVRSARIAQARFDGQSLSDDLDEDRMKGAIDKIQQLLRKRNA